MNGFIIFVSFIVCAFGLTLWFVFLNPFGFVIDSLGFMLFIYGLKKEDDNKSTPYPYYGKKLEHYKTEYQEDFKCRNCNWFGRPGCKRQEKLLNSEPCNDFMSKFSK